MVLGFVLAGLLRADGPGRRVLAYYVPYDPTSWASFEAHADAIDILGVQAVTIDACGGLSSRDDPTLRRTARERGVRVFPSLLTSSGWLNHQLLTDQPTSTHAVDQIANYVVDQDDDGFDLDLEAVDPGDRDALSAFVTNLAAALHANQKTLSLALPAKDRDVTVGWAGAYDYAALGAQADLVTIMTYDYHGSWSGPGSVAPYTWVSRVTAFATRQIPPSKVLVGLAFYGYDWNLSSGMTRALRFDQAAELAGRYGVDIQQDPATLSATFGFQAAAGDPPPISSGLGPLHHPITQHNAEPCGIQPPPTPVPTRVIPPALPDAIQDHEVWFEDGAATTQRLGLVDQYSAAGVAAWRLGEEDPAVWDALVAWRQ
jgi:spore germination protein YaaH